jgi:hypothetical protein
LLWAEKARPSEPREVGRLVDMPFLLPVVGRRAKSSALPRLAGLAGYLAAGAPPVKVGPRSPPGQPAIAQGFGGATAH